MSRDIVFVGLGGLVGCVARYLVVSFTASWLANVPLGTLLVNIAGCFLIGAGAGLAEHYEWMRGEGRILLLAGFCGGFTTYSAFALENLQFLIEKNYWMFGAYSAVTFALCVAAVAVGFFLTAGR
jgi:fluoride exporter